MLVHVFGDQQREIVKFYLWRVCACECADGRNRRR